MCGPTFVAYSLSPPPVPLVLPCRHNRVVVVNYSCKEDKCLGSFFQLNMVLQNFKLGRMEFKHVAMEPLRSVLVKTANMTTA